MELLEDIAAGIKFAIDHQKEVSHPRPYLGMSQLGHACSRYLWFYFRLAAKTTITARQKRIFARGDLEEDRVVAYLENIGVKILSRQTRAIDCDGHLSGHNDGLIANVPGFETEAKVLLEIKTMNEKAFKDISKNKLRISKPGYWVQTHTYMHYEHVDYCLFIAVNKNTEELYIEIVPFDIKVANKAIARGTDIIYNSLPPRKLSEDPKYFECNWCDFKLQCHELAPFNRTCRTCESARIHSDGQWFCTTHLKVLDFDAQLATCNKYSVLKI